MGDGVIPDEWLRRQWHIGLLKNNRGAYSVDESFITRSNEPNEEVTLKAATVSEIFAELSERFKGFETRL